jgi:hypothetical protein
MILFVATTGPPFGCAIDCGATSVAELVIEDKEVVDDEVNAVEPDSCDERELWLIVCPKPGRPLVLLMLPPALLDENTGAVLVLARGP